MSQSVWKYIGGIYLLVLLLSACSDNFDQLFPTITPVQSNLITPTLPLPAPDLIATPTLTVLSSPTPLCIVENKCDVIIFEETREGQALWEYTIKRYHKIQCVALTESRSPSPCKVRELPTLDSKFRVVPYGTQLKATALYHCEVFIYCDPQIVEWYYIQNEWAAALEYVWKDVTLPQD